MLTDFELELAALRAQADHSRRQGMPYADVEVNPATLIRLLDTIDELRRDKPAIENPRSPECPSTPSL